MSDTAPVNQAFLREWKRQGGAGRPVYAPMAAAVLGFRLWCKAVTAAGTTQIGPVRQYMLGQKEIALNGKTATVGVNHHIDMAVSVGRATTDRQFEIVWSAPHAIFGDPWAADKIIGDATVANAQRDLLDALPTPLIVLDEHGDVCYRSVSTQAYFGAVIAPDVLQRLREIIRDPAPRQRRLTEITAHDNSGGTRHMTVAVSRMVFAGQPAHLLSLADVTYIREIEDQLRILNGQLHELASTDPLTGVNNRRSFINAVTTGLQQMRHCPLPAAMFLLDLDHFKSLNDRFGHEIGDHALIQVAATARRIMRETDIFARIGGEEFAGFLPHTDMTGAILVAERLRHAVAEVELRAGDDVTGVTCSIGIAAVDAQADTLQTAMKRADQALYAAKREGRDRVRCDCEPART
jgi:diguanylate cyclase (GGDEF)-like protein